MKRSEEMARLRASIQRDEANRDELQRKLTEFAMTLNQEVTTLKQTNQAENLERARILQQMLNDHMTALMKSEQSRECEAARQANELADYLAKLMNRVSSMRKSNQQENLASRSGWLRGAVSV
ncbi:MAG: hypothetical protein WCJ40_03240 [Planctomycetota bacterium]|nr:hypothetical protein [Planctomycetota bacterium]